ncbi:MAG: hypothetical protein ABI748_08065, partial [Dokdonella sp.]
MARVPYAASRLIAALLIVAQVLMPAAAWGQATRSTAPSPPVVDAKGPPPPVPSKASDKRLALIIGNNNY